MIGIRCKRADRDLDGLSHYDKPPSQLPPQPPSQPPVPHSPAEHGEREVSLQNEIGPASMRDSTHFLQRSHKVFAQQQR